ncbi:MAG: amidohydrolase family protein [Phycisphaerae bacterium]|jgi:predicted TIM-barrel fold metal-dependent hydrolase|nr:amidohydrolase family protein [Phycisphaerae bacterium]
MENKTPILVDCHAHLWESPSQLGRCAQTCRLQAHPSAGKSVSSYDLKISAGPVSFTFLLGFRSKLMEMEIPNEFISDCVYQHSDCIIGFGSVDPVMDNLKSEIHKIDQVYKLAGFVVSPGGQGFHPTSTNVLPLYRYACDHAMPIIIHNGQPFGTPASEFSDPMLWAPVFREFNEVKFVFTDMGRPWTDHTLMLLGEFENVYMDLAGLASQTWVGYQTLIKGYQAGVLNKFLMGSDFPATGISATIEAIYSINQMVSNTPLPTIPRQRLREIVERDVLKLLSLDRYAANISQPSTAMEE